MLMSWPTKFDIQQLAPGVLARDSKGNVSPIVSVRAGQDLTPQKRWFAVYTTQKGTGEMTEGSIEFGTGSRLAQRMKEK
jgi:hypothetical protein